MQLSGLHLQRHMLLGPAALSLQAQCLTQACSRSACAVMSCTAAELAFCGVQVTSLALCKVNKSEMILRRLSQHFRHERAQELFWQNDEVPQEALDILKVGLCDNSSHMSLGRAHMPVSFSMWRDARGNGCVVPDSRSPVI